MSKVQRNSRRSSQILTMPAIQDSSRGIECHLFLSLLALLTIALLLSGENLQAQIREGEQVVTVTNTHWVRIRSTPEIRSDTVLTRVAGGVQLKHLETQTDWFRVELPDGSEGWLDRKYGRLDTARDLLEVAGTVVRIRETPSQQAPVISRAIEGVMLEIVDRQAPWYQVRLPMGEVGWIREDLVTLHEVISSPERETALSENTSEVSAEQTNQGNAAGSDSTGSSLSEMTPLPITASAGSVEDKPESGSLTLRSPENLQKPRFLLILISVVAGLSAFAVILVAGAVAIRRRTESLAAQEPTPSPGEGDQAEESVKEYSDPLLHWMSNSSHNATGNGHTKDNREWSLSSLPVSESSEPSGDESSAMEPEPSDSVHLAETGTIFEAAGGEETAEEEPQSETTEPRFSMTYADVSEKPEEQREEVSSYGETTTDPPKESPLEPAKPSILPIAMREETQEKRKTRSSRSRNKRKAKRRRRRR